MRIARRASVLFGALTGLLGCALAPAQEPAPPVSAAELLNRMWSQGRAEGAGPVRLATFPLRTDEISVIRPLGLMAGGHVTPSDHLYMLPKQNAEQLNDVLAIADGKLVCAQWRPAGNLDPTAFDRPVDIKLFIEHSATCWSYVDHVTALDPGLAAQLGEGLQPGRTVHVRIPVTAGQVLGTVANKPFDFALIDTTQTRSGFVRPEQFLARDPWKLHTVDPFDYVEEPLRSQLLACEPRQAEPRGGQIGYDIDGRLVGNWYLEGSGGYAGLNKRRDYWVGHLTFAYHFVDPQWVFVSLGDWDGQARQFQVRSNGPDPATITPASGRLSYELVMPYVEENTGRPYPDVHERFMGTLLVEMLDDRRIKVETLPGTPAEKAVEFTAAARIYER